MKFFIDFEATQFSNEIISVGCVSEKGDTFYTLVKPENKLTSFITELTGITQENIDAALEPDIVFADMFDWISSLSANDKNEFYCYGNCDVKFIKTNFNISTNFKAGAMLGFIRASLVDYSPRVKAHYGLCNPINLGKIADHIRGYEIPQAHNALGDALLLKFVFEEVESTPTDFTCIDLDEYRQGFRQLDDKEPEFETGVYMYNNKSHTKLFIKFKDMNAAIQCIMKQYGCVDATEKTINRIERKITLSAKNNTKYCNKFWVIMK